MNAAAPTARSQQLPSPGPGRGLVIAASISSAVLASGLSLVVQYLSSSWQDERARRITEVTKFVDSAQQFDGLVTAFMGPFLKNANSRAQREALRENTQSQFSLLETARANLDSAQSKRAKDYEDSLVVVATELDKDQPAPAAFDLVQAIATTRAKNVCVIFDLRRKAGLPVVKSDENPCEQDLKRFDTR